MLIKDAILDVILTDHQDSSDTLSVLRINLDRFDEKRWSWMDIELASVGTAFPVEPLGDKKIRTSRAHSLRLESQGQHEDSNIVTEINEGDDKVDGRYIIVIRQPHWSALTYDRDRDRREVALGPASSFPRVHVCDEVFVVRLKRIDDHEPPDDVESAHEDWKLTPVPSREVAREVPALMATVYAEFYSGYSRRIKEPDYWPLVHQEGGRGNSVVL